MSNREIIENKLFFECEKGNQEDYNFVSHGNPNQIFTVSNSSLEAFWQNYCELVDNKQCLMIAEKMETDSPIIFKGKFYNDLFFNDINNIFDIVHDIQIILLQYVKDINDDNL